MTGLFTELLGVGGVQEAGRLTASALHDIAGQRGWSLDFLALNDENGSQTLRADEKEIPFHGFSRAKARFVRSAIGRARAAIRCETHIILAGHPNLGPIAVWMQKTSPRSRAIVVAHGVEVWKPLPVLRRAAIRAAFRVVAPSSYTLQKLVEVQRVPADHTCKLAWPLAPAFTRFVEHREELFLPVAFPEGDVVLTVGRAVATERYKGVDILIQAFAQLCPEFPALRLVSVGGGDDLPRLQNLAKELGVADRVRFLHGISRQELAACYAHCAIFALPSSGEGFGIVFLEAMAFGKPVVAAAAAGALDVVRDEVNGLLVPPQDTAALATTLRRLLADKSLRESLGRRGAAIVREAHQFASFRDELEHLLGSCTMDSRLHK